MSEAQNFDFKISIPNAKHRVPVKRLYTLDTLKEWIRDQGFDDYTVKGLIEMASKYPNPALPKFAENINVMLNRVRNKRRKELSNED